MCVCVACERAYLLSIRVASRSINAINTNKLFAHRHTAHSRTPYRIRWKCSLACFTAFDFRSAQENQKGLDKNHKNWLQWNTIIRPGRRYSKPDWLRVGPNRRAYFPFIHNISNNNTVQYPPLNAFFLASILSINVAACSCSMRTVHGSPFAWDHFEFIERLFRWFFIAFIRRNRSWFNQRPFEK